MNVNYAQSPNPKGEGSPVHITVSILPTKGGRVFTSGEGELYMIDKSGKMALKEIAPLAKLCPT